MASLSTPTLGQVTQVFIPQSRLQGMCIKGNPCTHTSCKITLADGRERTVDLNGSRINALIQAIAKGKIVNPWGEEHFKEFRSELENADAVLAEIFKEKMAVWRP